MLSLILIVVTALSSAVDFDMVPKELGINEERVEKLQKIKSKIMAMRTPSEGMQEFIDIALERRQSFIPATPPVMAEELKEGDHVWWYDAENQWWMTGKLLGEVENGKGSVNPTHITGESRWPVDVLVLKPNKMTNMWKSQKVRDMGDEARADKDNDVAKELFLAANILDKNNPHAAYSLAIYNLFGTEERDFEHVKDLFIEAVNRDAGWWRGYHGLGVTYRMWGKNTDALRVLNKAFDRHPLNTKVLDDLGHINFEIGHYEESCFFYLLLDSIRSFMKEGITLLPDRVEFCKNHKNEL